MNCNSWINLSLGEWLLGSPQEWPGKLSNDVRMFFPSFLFVFEPHPSRKWIWTLSRARLKDLSEIPREIQWKVLVWRFLALRMGELELPPKFLEISMGIYMVCICICMYMHVRVYTYVYVYIGHGLGTKVASKFGYSTATRGGFGEEVRTFT